MVSFKPESRWFGYALVGSTLAALTSFAACGGDPDPSEGAWIEVGTGTDGFVPLTEGQEVDIIFGPQGGYHVWGALRAQGLDGDDVQLQFALTNAAGEVVADAVYWDDLPIVGDMFVYDRVTVILHPDVPPETISGQTMTLAVQVETPGGITVNDRVDIVPRCCVDQLDSRPWIELGVGETNYEKAVNGQDIELVEHGGEVGFWAAVRAGDINEDNVRVDVMLAESREVVYARGGVLLNHTPSDDDPQDLSLGEWTAEPQGGGFVFTGIWVPLREGVATEDFIGVPTTLGLRLIDGELWEDDVYANEVIPVLVHQP